MLLETTYHLADYLAGPVPDISPVAPPGSSKFQLIVSWVFWGAALAALVAFVIVGAKFGYEKRQGTADSEAGERTAKICIGLVIMSAAGALVGAIL